MPTYIVCLGACGLCEYANCWEDEHGDSSRCPRCGGRTEIREVGFGDI